MRWPSSCVILILLLAGLISAQTPSTPADTTTTTGTSVAMPSGLPPIVNPQTPALFDPRANMAYIEGRDVTWLMPDVSGRKRLKEGPKRVTGGFYMDRTEVTCSDFAQFLSAADTNAAFYDSRMDIVEISHGKYRARSGREKYPVAWADWTAAFAFAKWAGKSLPTEDEWIVAALAGKPLRSDTTQYLWNDSTQCNHLSTAGFPGARAVASNPQNANTAGISDLAGNVAEWTLTEEPSPIAGGKTHTWIVVKGGSFLDSPASMTLFSRGLRDRSERLSSVGFRCILREPAR